MTPERADYYLGLLVAGGAIELEKIETKEQKGTQSRHETNHEEEAHIRSNVIKLTAIYNCLRQMTEQGFAEGSGLGFPTNLPGRD